MSIVAAPRRQAEFDFSLPRRFARRSWERVLDESFLERAALRWHQEKPVWRDRGDSPEAAEWETHWQRLNGSLLGRVFSWYRRAIRSRCVRHFIDRSFPPRGVFAECGCGSGETSIRLGGERTLLAVDFCERALLNALSVSNYVGGLLADIRRLPFRDASLDGIWNLGVMEHFEEDEQIAVLREFHRVLKPGGCMLLWWPPPLALDRIALSTMPALFPGEPGRVSASCAAALLRSAGFESIQVSIPVRDCLTELVVCGRASPGPTASVSRGLEVASDHYPNRA